MKEIGLALVALIATTATSNSQGTATSPESSGASGLCWDTNANMILPDYKSTFGSAPPSSQGGTATLPSDTTGTVGSALPKDSDHTDSTFSKNATGTENARPAGIPDCD